MPFWYEQDRRLFESEIASMNTYWPGAQYGFFEDGRMYWKVNLVHAICGERKEWTVLAVYCTDYPAEHSFRFYPVSPSYREMTEMVRLSDVTPKVVPHMFRDDHQNICFDIADPYDALSKTAVESIVPGIARVARWIDLFETGIKDPKAWEMFCGKRITEVNNVNEEIKRTDENEENPSPEEECTDRSGQDNLTPGEETPPLEEKGPECPLHEDLTPIEKWIQKSPQARSREIEYLQNAGFQYPLQVTAAEDVQQAFMIDKWMFLMVIDKTFPKETETAEIPIRICLVAPNLSEFERMIPRRKIPCVEKDHAGIDTLQFPIFQQEYEKYLNGQLDKLLTETLLLHAREWVGGMLQAIQKEKNKRTGWEFGIRMPSFLNRGQSRNTEEEYYSSNERRPKYVDGRQSVNGRVNPRCKKIVLSDRAYIQIFNESQSRIQTETGGLLLGHFDNGIWYVIEASDPGINAKFYNAYHEGDDVYENHVCGVISRTYKHPLVFLGMWHRHPGSLDSFSGTDDGTNYKYAGSAGNGCISAIINYDPAFRITFYYAEQGDYQRVYYTKVDVEVGDDKIPNKEMLKVASVEDVLRRRQ